MMVSIIAILSAESWLSSTTRILKRGLELALGGVSACESAIVGSAGMVNGSFSQLLACRGDGAF